MSFLVGPISGALVSAGVYYGFSNLITTRTAQHRREMHDISVRLLAAQTYIPAPTPAAVLIDKKPFQSMLKEKWNQEVEELFSGANTWDKRVEAWARKLLYGSGNDVKP